MRGVCDGCGRSRKICFTLNPKGSFIKILKNGEVVVPEEKKFCQGCGRIAIRRVTEWGLEL